MSEFLRVLGYDPLRFWALAWTCFGLWVLASLLPFDPRGSLARRLGSPLNCALLLLLALVAFRWPTFLYKPVNPDEPQFLAGALTMLSRREFWWPDAMSSGPLVMLPLTLPAAIGAPIDYVAGRMIALLLAWGLTLCTSLTLQRVHGERLGRLLTLPLGTFMVLLNFWDFTAYSSEWLPLFLASLAAWLCSGSFAVDGSVCSRSRLFFAGLVLGAIPFSKIQVLPLGLAIGLGGLGLVWFQPPAPPRRARDFSALLGGTLAAFALLVAWLAASGNLPHFLNAYGRYNLFYAGDRSVPWSGSLGELAYLTGFSWGFSSFHCGELLLAATGAFGLVKLPRERRKPVLAGLVLLAASYYAVLAPGRAYPHYLLFLTMPLAMATSLLFGNLLRPDFSTASVRAGLIAGFLLVGVGSQIVERTLVEHSLLRLIPAPGIRTSITGVLKHLKRPGDTLAVWGWRPELYVETQLPQAVRDAHTERQMKPSPLRAYFRQRFLDDLHAAPPPFFIDAVGQGGFLYQERAEAGLETFPELDRFIGENYRLLGEIDSFRLYLRRDRSAVP